ncbi:unnamed protein product, partial [marine sediment metagenome]
EDNCVHHWILDDKDIGRCIKRGCGAVRDFRKELRKWQRGESEVSAKGGKRGRPRKANVKEELA